MPRFFCDNISGDSICITGEDAVHISRSIRMRCGDELTVCDGNGIDYDCVIKSITMDTVSLDVVNKYPSESEPSCKMVLYQAIPKGDKTEFIIQKAIELGVAEIVLVQSKFCVAKIDEASQEKKLKRYNKIAKEAAKQSGRGIIPRVSSILNFSEAISDMKQYEVQILFYENAVQRMNRIVTPDVKSVAFMIGSEGGFSEEEVKTAEDNGVTILSLGKRILRCETAPIVAATLIMNSTENI